MEWRFERKVIIILLLIVMVMLAGSAMLWHWGSRGQTLPTADTDSTLLEPGYKLLREQPDSIGGNWLRTLNPKLQDVQGSLVWSSKLQQGVMRLVNLPPPRSGFEYRLWIYDSRSESGAPVPGASLRQGSGKKTLFAKLSPPPGQVVQAPFKFVLTLEAVTDQAVTDDVPDAEILLMVQP